MKRQSGILAGTALGLLMASTPLSALLLSAPDALPTRVDALAQDSARVILVQNTKEEEEEQQQQQQAPAEQPAEEPQAQQEQPAEAPPAEEAAPAQEEAPAEQQAAPEEAPAEETPAQAEQPPAEEPAEQQAAPEEAPAEETPAQAEQPPAEEPAEQQAAPEEAPAESSPAQAETPAEEPAEETAEEPAPDEAPAEQQAAPEEAPTEETPAQADTPAEEPDAETAEEPATDEAPAEQQAAPEEAPAEDTPAQAEGEQPADGQAPAEEQAAPDAEQDPAQAGTEQPATGEQAPVLDSAKEAAPADAEGAAQEGQAAGEQQQQEQAPAQAATPPQSDEDAQVNIQVQEIEPVTAEEGQRIELGNTREERRRARRERRERRENAEVIREFEDNRVIVEFGDRVFIESPDYERIILEDDDVYYEELPRGRTREVIVRPDGTRVVTVRNRYGDIIRRSRILPDDREVVLVYVEDRYYDEVLEFRDPGASLPPLQLTIPRDEYILEAEEAEDADTYYAFLDQPPVDQLERTYSVEEVKRSARIRDTVRRIDLDTINFEFGSAEIAESEIDELEGVATAIQRLLEENPAETFLIEGHTDAVGTDIANLALSDRRAEAVATALTNAFDIPPENLVTQGYGEQYLKVETQEPERENRRVAMRRITPLVKPVASAE